VLVVRRDVQAEYELSEETVCRVRFRLVPLPPLIDILCWLHFIFSIFTLAEWGAEVRGFGDFRGALLYVTCCCAIAPPPQRFFLSSPPPPFISYPHLVSTVVFSMMFNLIDNYCFFSDADPIVFSFSVLAS